MFGYRTNYFSKERKDEFVNELTEQKKNNETTDLSEIGVGLPLQRMGPREQVGNC